MKPHVGKMDENDNYSSCSLTSEAANANSSMLLRSYCRSAKCSAGEHYSSTPQKHSKEIHSRCSGNLFETDSFSTCETHCVTSLHSVEVKHRHSENIDTSISRLNQKVTGYACNEDHCHSLNKLFVSNTAATESSLQVLNVQINKKNFKAEAPIQSELKGDAMARTLYKRNALARTLHYTDATESDYVPSTISIPSFDGHVNKNNHHTGYRLHHSSSSSLSRHHQQQQSVQDSSMSSFHNSGDASTQRTSVYRRNEEDESDDGDIIVTDDASSSKQSEFWSFFSWRKHLYFTLSKPTHFDVEILARIATLGKGKTILLLLLPLLFAVLASTWPWSSTTHQQAVVPDIEGENCHFLLKWWPFSKLVHSFVPSQELKSYQCDTVHNSAVQDDVITVESAEDSWNVVVNQKIQQDVIAESKFVRMTREEIKVLIQEVVKEEITQILYEKSKQEKLKVNEIHKIKKEIDAFGSKFNSLSDLFDSFKGEIDINSEKSSKFEKMSSHQVQELDQMRAKLGGLKKMIVEVAKNCCTNDTQLNRKLAAMLLSILDESEDNPFKPIREWLLSKFISKEQLEEKMSAVTHGIKSQEDRMNVASKTLIAEHVAVLKKQFSESGHSSLVESSLSLEDVQKIVREAILLYDADKTGETDFALESGGGAVVNTRCSETYNEGRPSYVFFGLTLWNVKSSPRNAIQPDLHPGECWAFKGSQGFLVIELSATIRPTSFVIEHIPKSLSPTGSIDSAPKEFSVWGLASEKDSDGKLLGEYVYHKDGEPLQRFPVQATGAGFYPYVELQIHSNHGDLRYTCLYRFRVHGTRT